MNTLIGIQGHGGAQETIWGNAPFWPISGADMIGLGADDSQPQWPEYFIAAVVSRIRPGKWLGYGLRPTLSADSLVALRNCAVAGGYDSILWTECDSVFLGPIPNFNQEAFNCVIAGYCPPEWNCGRLAFVHPPFLMSVTVADCWCETVLQVNTETGNGAPDVFVPIVCAQAGIPLMPLAGTYSCNGLDMRLESKMREARASASNGCWHIHGIKRKDHLDYILQKTETFPADTL